MKFILILFLILFINKISCYSLVLDLNSNIKYENSNCGDLDQQNNQVLPPCKNWHDLGERSRNLVISYENEFKSELTIYILNSRNQSVIQFNDNGEMVFGELRNYCKVYFKIVNNLKLEDSEARVELKGKKLYDFGSEGFIVINETLVDNFKCKDTNNILLSIYNFNFNGNEGSIIDNAPLNSNNIYIRKIMFINCIFNHTRVLSAQWEGQGRPVFKKSILFHSCNFTNSIDTQIDASFTQIEINNCNFNDFYIIYKPLISLGINSNLIMNNSNIYNGLVNGIIESKYNNHEIIFNNINIYNNTIQFIIIADNRLFYIQYNNFKVSLSNVHFYTNNLIDGYGLEQVNTYSEYNGLFDLSLYSIQLNESFIIDKSIDNTLVSIFNSTFNNNHLYKQFSLNFIKVDSITKIYLSNSFIGYEFNTCINAPNPYLLNIKNSTINSIHPIVGSNIKISLNNNQFSTDIDQSKTIFNKTTHSSNRNNGSSNNNGYESGNFIQEVKKREQKKRYIIIPTVLIIVLIALVALFFIIQKITKYINNKQQNNNNVINEDEAIGENNYPFNSF